MAVVVRGELNCAVCGRGVDPRGPGICEYTDLKSGKLVHGWVEFLEDWRGGHTTWLHAVCFAEKHGVAALIAAVHKRDLLNRGVVPRLMMEINQLRKRGSK